MLLQKRPKHTVHETRRAITPVRLGEFNRFVHRDFDRHVCYAFQFVQRHSQNVAINNRELLHGPFGRVFRDEGVQMGARFDYAFGEQLRKLFAISRKVFFVIATAFDHAERVVSNAVNFKKGLKREGAGLASGFQLNTRLAE